MFVVDTAPYIRSRYSSGMMGKFPRNRLLQIRTEHGLSQAQLGALCVPRATAGQIEKIENSKQELTLSWMHRLGRALQVHPAEFMLDVPHPLPDPREAGLIEKMRGFSEPGRNAVFREVEKLSKRRASSSERKPTED